MKSTDAEPLRRREAIQTRVHYSILILKESLSGSIIDPSSKKFLKNILRDDKKEEFNRLFLEGLEDSTNFKHEDIFNR
jgi:hypothetical protein